MKKKTKKPWYKKQKFRVNKNAFSTVFSYLISISIVVSTIAIVYLWGLPFVDEKEKKYSLETAFNEIDKLDKTINNLMQGGLGELQYVEIQNPNEKGSMIVNPKSNRMILSYSFTSGFTFDVKDLNDVDLKGFTVNVNTGSSINGLKSVNIWRLNDETCFLAGTKILMSDNSYKNIEEIEIGDLVRSYDEEKKCIVNNKVTHLFHHSAEKMADYYLIINNDLCVTPNHRFYSDGQWVVADDLKTGDMLFNIDKSDYEIRSIDYVFNKVKTYDFEVENSHTYYVNIGSDRRDVLVHNENWEGNNPENAGIKFFVYDLEVDDVYTGFFYKMEFTGLEDYDEDDVLKMWCKQQHVADFPVEPNYSNKIGVNYPDSIYIPWCWVIPGDADQNTNWEIKFTINDDLSESKIIKVDVEEGWNRVPSDIMYSSTGEPNGGDITINYENGEYTIDNSDFDLEGSVRIDLYSDADVVGDPVPDGRIWLFDLGSISHNMYLNDGNYQFIYQNGGVISREVSDYSVVNEPGFYENNDDNDELGFRVIMIRGSDSGSGKGSYNFYIKILHNYLREMEKDEGISNFKMQIYGDNADTWLDYYKECYNFDEDGDNKIKYNKNNCRFTLASGLLEMDLMVVN